MSIGDEDRRAIRQIAKELARLQRKVEDRTPQLIHSTIQDGSVNIRDTDGLLTGAVGLQVDGRFGAVSLGGPPPPIPAKAGGGPASSGGAILAQWAGGWADNVSELDPDGVGGPTVAPTTFSHVEVHASPDPDFTGLLFSTLKGQINSARGGWLYIEADPAVPLYVRLVARDRNGKASAASEVAGPFTAVKVPPSYLDVDFDTIGGNTIFYGAAEPTTDRYGDLWLKDVTPVGATTPQYETWRWVVGSPDHWEELEDQGAASSLAAALAAQQAADSKAQVFDQSTEPAWTGDAGTAVWIDDDGLSHVWDGTDFVAKWLGNGAFQPNSLVASDVFATGTVTAALFEALMVLANIIILGDQNGQHTRLDDTGLTYQAVTPDGVPYEAARFGTDAGGTDPSGNVIWNVDENGIASLQGLSVTTDPIIMGIPFTEHITGFGEFLAGASRGANIDPAHVSGAGELGYYEFTVEVGANELCILQSSNMWVRPDTGCNRVDVNIRYTVSTDPNVDPPPVSLASPLWGRAPSAEQGSTNTLGHVAIISKLLRYPVYAHFRFLVSLFTTGGGAYFEMQSANHLDAALGVTIEPDVVQFFLINYGPIPWTNRAVDNDGGGTTTPAAKKRYTYDYFSHWSRSFTGAGGTFNNNADCYQGQTPYYPANGNMATQIGDFSRPNSGPSLATDLAGATVEKLQVYLYAKHWHYSDGGTAVIRYHNNSVAGSLNNYAGQINVGGWARGQGRWVDITAWASLFQGTGAKGIQVGPGVSTDAIYYGYFYGPGSSQAPRIRATFTK